MNIMIHYRSDGNGKLKPCYPIIQEIVWWYSSGKIVTITGDVWTVVKSQSPDADYIALMA